MQATLLVVSEGVNGFSTVGFNQNILIWFDYLLYGGLPMWIDGVAAVKVDSVVALVIVVVVAKVDSLR